jgi:hypothetical protein
MATHVANISETEIAQRRKEVRAATASLRLEGMQTPEHMDALTDDYVAGRIDAHEMQRTVLGWYGLTEPAQVGRVNLDAFYVGDIAASADR